MADFEELSYATPGDPAWKRWIVRSIEHLSGRPRLLPLYRTWRESAAAHPDRMMREALRLLEMRVEVIEGAWPSGAALPAPLVMVSNHPFGIADGLVMLAMAEAVGRPYRVFVDKRLLRIPELRPLALPIDFDEGRAAMRTNLRSRKAARACLETGGTIVIFPAGGVATARPPWARARELPWKNFAGRLVQGSRAAVLPVRFEGQNSVWFHLASHLSMTLRQSLLVSEFMRRGQGAAIRLRIFEVRPFEALEHAENGRLLTAELFDMVGGDGPPPGRARGAGAAPQGC
jgi:putative hemolysin